LCVDTANQQRYTRNSTGLQHTHSTIRS
jgi:hypothetical protein